MVVPVQPPSPSPSRRASTTRSGPVQDQTYPICSDNNAPPLCPTKQGPKHAIRREPLQQGAVQDHGVVHQKQPGLPCSSILPTPCCRPHHTPFYPPAEFPPDDRFAARNFRAECLQAHVLVHLRQDEATKLTPFTLPAGGQREAASPCLFEIGVPDGAVSILTFPRGFSSKMLFTGVSGLAPVARDSAGAVSAMAQHE
jgi:hypothetical protein